MSQGPLSGIIYYGPDRTIKRLLLETSQVEAFILDVSARVSVTQTFINYDANTIAHARYVFPVPARSALCSFEMRAEDGRVVTGVVKQKDAARKDFEGALRERKTAGIVEWVSADLFTISIGSLPSQQQIKVNLVYVMDLMDHEVVDHVRFQIPMCLGERYGVESPGLQGALRPTNSTKVKITVNIQMYRTLQSITSPSHEDSLIVEPYQKSDRDLSQRRAIAKLRLQTYLTGDFVLIIHTKGLDAPRCFAELDERTSATVALQLTFVPKFRLPPIPSQEYIFVIDRSGSMSGSKITTARTTLGLLIRMLPNNNSTLNVVGFGTHFQSLWGRSRRYDAASLDEASRHVAAIEADYGGTEIRKTLENVFVTRDKLAPTVVFLLTDGEAYDTDQTIATVKRAVDTAPPHAPLRVFTLGVGHDVSTAMVEGIAAAGRGTCLLAVSAEGILPKCAQLFRAGRASTIKNIAIDWGIASAGTTSHLVATADASVSDNTFQLAAPPFIQQSPSLPPDIYPSTRCRIFAIVARKFIPSEVTLRGQLDGEGDVYEIVVPVRSASRWNGEADGLPLVHVLAARGLIGELDIGSTSPPPAIVGSPSEEQRREAAIVRLGVKYQLASRHTSFVAVESGVRLRFDRTNGKATTSANGLSDSRGSQPSGPNGNTGDARTSEEPAGEDNDPKPTSLNKRSRFRLFDYLKALLGALDLGRGNDIEQLSEPQGPWDSAPGAWPGSQIPQSEDGSAMEDDGYWSEGADSYSTMSSLISYSDDEWTPPPSPKPKLRPVRELPAHHHDAPALESVENAPADIKQQHAHRAARLSTGYQKQKKEVPRAVVELVALQSFNGSFVPSPNLRRLVGEDALDDVPEDVTQALWATALAVAYFKRHLFDQPDLLAGLLEKATEFARSVARNKPGVPGDDTEEGREQDFESLVSRASSLLT